MKKYVLIAGANGVGKSTLYESVFELRDMKRINVDELVREIGSWKNPADILSAGKMAVARIEEYFYKGVSFSQETTLCGKSIIKNILRARELGYFVETHYIGVDNANLAKQRIARRVANGGHGIPDEDVVRRFYGSFVQLKEVLPMIDLLIFYDNTIKFNRFALFERGKLRKASKNVPEWFQKYIMYNNEDFATVCSVQESMDMVQLSEVGKQMRGI